MNNLKTLVSKGNRKIAKNTAIFNLCSGTDCPMKDNCTFGISGKCYALKAERMYKAVLPYRRRQAQYWNNTSLSDKTDHFTSLLHGKVKYLRISESGDVKDYKDLLQLDYIASSLKNDHGITTYTYTHNLNAVVQALEYISLNNIVINLSIDDLNIDYYNDNLKILNSFNVFYAIKNLTVQHKNTCPGSGCMDTCKKCAVNHGTTVYCKIH